MSLEYKEQSRIIKYSDNDSEARVPEMPLLVVFNDGTIGEARTLRGMMALLIGNEYYDAEDAIDEWHLRVEAARREAMRAMSNDIDTVIYDARNGIIKNNYAADPGDPDYDLELDAPPFYIRVDNARLFILSLMKLGIITVLERDDSYLLRENKENKSCKNCIFKEESTNEKIQCSVYKEVRELDEGSDCSSFADYGNNQLYSGGVYIDLIQEYDIDELIKLEESLLTI